MATVPSIPTFTVGQKLTAAEQNSIKAACDWSISGRPKCVLTASVVQAISNGAYTALNFDTEALDNDSMHTGTQPYIVANTAGWYSLSGAVGFAANATGYRFASFYINSASEVARVEVVANSVAGRGTSISLSAFIYLNVGDNVVIGVQQSSGGALNTTIGATTSRFTALWESS